MNRINTQLEATGAEHLVLGNLLRLKIQAFITSRNFQDYDIVAVNPEKKTSLKIQVKSRLKETDMSFPIKKFGSDFVVFVKLNCGRRKDGSMDYEYRKPPEFYVFPTEICSRYNKVGDWHKLHLKDVPECVKYKDNWQLIKNALEI